MSLIAIIAHDRRAVVEQAEIDELAQTYAGLRGGRPGRSAAVGGYVRAIELDSGTERQESALSDGSWVMTAGVPHGDTASEPARVEEFEGQFALVAHDAETGEVSVASDPFGMLAVYVAQRDQRTYVATSALALAKHLRAKPSRLGLEIFLLAGYQFGTVTNWEGIERVDPGTRVVFAKDGVRRETYWRPQVDPQVAKMSLEEAVRYCSDVASATYARRLASGSRPWADLTGGFDTRLLVVLLRNAGLDFRTNTVGDDGNDDVQIARRLAEIGGWEWLQLKLPADWGEVIPTILPTAVAWSDGHLDVLQLSQVLWGHREKSRAARSLMIGGGGEHFRNFAWQQEFLKGGKSTEVNLDNWINMRLLHPMDTSVFAGDPTAEVKADLRERMVAWAAPYASELNTTQLDVMYAYKVTGHFGAYLSSARAFVEPQLPFYFRPVWLAAFSTSYRHRNNHRLMRRLISTLDGRIAAVQTSNGGPAEPQRVSNLHRFVPYYADIGRRAFNKLTEKATGRALLAPSHRPDDRIVSGRRAVLDQLASGGGLSAGTMRTGRLYDPAALDQLVQRAMAPDFADDQLLGRIVTLELALQAADATLDE
jgi:Glutamine amidotransferase domain